MKITYIPPVPVAVTPLLQPSQEGMNWMERVMSNAIQSTIVEPFQSWCLGVWTNFVDASLPICTVASLTALMLTMIGVKKAKQWVIIPILVYLFIQMINFIVLGG